jgi:chromosome segregation ATPase
MEGWRAAEEGAPGRYARVRNALMAMEAALLKARKLLPAFREMCAGFSQEAHAKYLAALNCRDRVEEILRPCRAGDGGGTDGPGRPRRDGRRVGPEDFGDGLDEEGGDPVGEGAGAEEGAEGPDADDMEDAPGLPGGPDAPALTAYTASLREALAEARSVREARERWLREVEDHLLEIENCTAALGRERAAAPEAGTDHGRGAGVGPGGSAGRDGRVPPGGGGRREGTAGLADLDDPDWEGDPGPAGEPFGAPGAYVPSGVSRWAAAMRSLSARAASFERRHEELARGGIAAERKLKGALNILTAAERRFSGERSIAFRDGAEALGASVESLLAAVLRSRGQLASFWRASPALVGRPAFLEKIYLSAAVNLGLAQGILEETRHRLDSATRRLSATRKIRREAEEFLAARGASREARERLWQADRALNVLKASVRGLLESERLRAEGARLKAEGRRLKARLAEAEDGLGRAERDRLRVEEELLRSEGERVRAEEELARSEEERVRAREERSRLELERLRFEGEIARSGEERARIEEERARFEEERVRLEGERVRLEEETRQAREELARAEDGRERAEREAESGRREARQAQEEWRRDREAGERELASEREARQEREAGLREAEARLAAVAAERERLSAELADAQRNLSESGEVKAQLVKLVSRAREALRSQAGERRAVQEELADLKRTLDPLRRKHRRLSELFGEGRRRLKAVEAELRERTAEAEAARAELAGLAEAGSRREAEFRLREEEYRRQEAELGRLEAERAGYLDRLQGLSADIARAEAERDQLSQRQRELSAHLEELKAREAALALKLAGKEEELKEASRTRMQLGELISQAQLHLDRVSRAHNALRNSWRRRGAQLAQAGLERDDLRLRLDRRSGELVEGAQRLQEAKAELGEAAARRAELERERDGLLAAIEEARLAAQSSAENEDRLARELEALKASAALGGEGDLAPLVEILGIALWRSGLEIQKGRERTLAALEDQRLASGAREAGLRVEMASRELGHMEETERQVREMEEMRAENARLAAEIAALPRPGPGAAAAAEVPLEPLEIAIPGEAGGDAGWGEGDGPHAGDYGDRLWLARELAAAFLTAEFRRARLKERFAEFRRREAERRAGDESARAELKGLMEEKDRALEEHKARVAQLVPLVEFFLEEGRVLWCGQGVARDGREALVYFLLEENRRLAAEVEELSAERQEAAASRRALTALTESMKERLATLRPLLEFLASAFQENTLALARAYAHRDGLAREASRLREQGEARRMEAEAAQTPPFPEGMGEAAAGELSRLRTEGARLARENEQLSSTAERQREELATLRIEAARLAGEMAGLAEERAGLAEERARLEREMERLSGEIAIQEARAEQASRELAEYREVPPSDGRVETAWAALNYLGARAGDAVSRLESQLAARAREIEETFAELQRRGERIKELERRQDRLSLMYWIMITLASRGLTLGLPGGTPEGRGGDGPGGGDSGEGGGSGGADPGAGGSPDGGEPGAEGVPGGGAPGAGGVLGGGAPGLAGALSGEAAAAPSRSRVPSPETATHGGILSRVFLKSLRDAAKRSLFSLVVSGGIAVGAAAQAGADDWKLPPSDSPAGPDALRRQGFSPFHGVRGGIQGPPPVLRPEPARSIPVIATKMRSATLGRTLDLGFLPPMERDVTEREAEELAREVLRRQAGGMGLDLEGWVGLAREAVPEGWTVYLPDLEGPAGALRLLRPRLPRVAEALGKAGGETPDWAWPLAVQGAAALKPGEGQFWERLFGDFLRQTGAPAEAAMGTVFHLSRRDRLAVPVVEFVGVMSPVREVEAMPHRRLVEFLAPHLRAAWNAARGCPGSGPSPAQARRLASDLYHASRIFRIPLTFLSSAACTDWTRGGLWPSTVQVYAGALAVAGLVSRSTRSWDPSSRHICDLDEIAPVYAAAARSAEELLREREALARSAAAAGTGTC